MKTKNIFSYIGLALVMGLTLTACTQDDEIQSVKTANGFYVYPIDFDCAVSGYDEGMTRAETFNWNKKTSLFARFQSGSTYYLGLLSLEDNGWELISTNDFLNLTTSGTCELFYLQEANGDYYYINLDTQSYDVYNNGSFVRSTSLAWNNSLFELSEGTAAYATTTATYTYSPTGYTIKATLAPTLWRMRFKGTDGTSITMPAAENDIKYCSAFNFNWSSTEAPSFTKAAKNVSLSVNGNYTPYIYGEFNSTSSNKITVQNGSDTFTRNLSAASLPIGKGGYLSLPTASNYSSLGWTMTIKEEPMALKDMLEKPMTNVNANLKTDSYQTIRDAVAKSYKIGDYTTNDGRPWFSLRVRDNDNCSNLTYQGLPFDYFSCFKNDDGKSVSYNFLIEKSKASYNYNTYLDKILQDFKNLNISLDSRPSESSLANYYGNDEDKNSYVVTVYEYDTDKYQFYIYASYKSSSSGMALKDMLEKPMTNVNVNLKTESYQTIRDAVAKSYKIEDYTATTDGQPWFNLSVGDNDNCSNLTYQGLPFSNFSCFKSDNGKSVSYHFLVEKSKASYNYKTYLDKILQDFKNLNILLDSHPDDDYLDRYTGYDADKNYYSVSVEEYYDKEKYLFYIYASYKSSAAVIIWQGEQSCGGFDGSSLRFSNTEGKLPTLSDATYDEMVGKKMCVDIKDVKIVAGYPTTIKVTNGWWSEDYVKDTQVKAGDTFEFEFTKHMADQCKKGGEGKDLMFVSNNGLTITKFSYKP